MALAPRGAPTAARCLGVVGTAFIEPDGGRANIAAKTLATLWYLLVLPDAQTRLSRQLRRKRLPWYAPSRVLGAAIAAANIATMPFAWGLLVAGRKNASRLATLGVLVNPPSVTLSTLLVTEISSALIRRAVGTARGVVAIVSGPFKKKEQSQPAPVSDVPPVSTPPPSNPVPATPAPANPKSS